MPSYVETMFSVRKVPWHRLGLVVTMAPSSRDALEMSGLNWRVSLRPLAVEAGGGRWVDGQERLGVVRHTDNRVLGVVSQRYRPIQNEEAFDFVDQLLGGGDIRYEAAGSLGQGKTVWLLARMTSEHCIVGDRIDPYLLFTNSHSGKASVKALMTPVRVVCANTLNLALHGAPRTWTAAHVGDIFRKVSGARETLGLARSYMEHLSKKAGTLAGIPIDENRWNRIVNELIPIPPSSSKPRKQNIYLLRNDLRERRRAKDLANYANTGWDSLNAVADHVAHVPSVAVLAGRKDFDPNIGLSETRFYSVVAGHQMLDRAVKIIEG